ncbi:MAG: hypothetical protein J5I93_24720 [Pirellulaceae bacterium]|nr:hypothetical protein [Pirellulaceae bacterium]
MSEYSKYQRNIIKGYYDNREGIALQRVQELVTELYLSEGKKRERYWTQLRGHLEKLGLKPDQIDHLVQQDRPELVANLVKKMFEKT